MSLLLQIIGVIIGVGASAVTFRIPYAAIMGSAMAGLIGWEVSQALSIYGVQSLYCATLGALCISLTAELLARAKRMPAIVFVVTGILPLVPGTKTYKAMLCLVQGAHEQAAVHSMDALLVAGGIAIGMLMGSAIDRAWIHPTLKKWVRDIDDDEEEAVAGPALLRHRKKYGAAPLVKKSASTWRQKRQHRMARHEE